jgi:signal transduction histidine kinase
MEAVGRLAGGVAHDFNNLLTVIQGYGTLLRQQLASADLDVKRADVILEAAEAASTLTQQLLSISLRQVVQMSPVCLNDLVERSTRVVQGLVTVIRLLRPLTVRRRLSLRAPMQVELIY